MSGRSVLVVEHERGAADEQVATLTHAGNSVFRCFPREWGVARSANPFACTAVTHGSCPLEDGVDVVIVKRDGATRPSIFEAGSLCAVRAAVPLAEIGETTDVLTAVEAAIEASYEEIRLGINWRVAAILSEEGLRQDALEFRFRLLGSELHVEIVGPPLPAAVQDRIAVRVADAIRATRRSFSKKSVSYVLA